MNDDLVVSKILKLLENNTAFIGYALNGGIGTKINVRNTETGKTIQALSINVDSSGEVLVVKDSNDGKYKAVTFKAAEQVTERIIQIRKTKPVDDKKIIEYTDSDIEVFYLFVKLVDTGSPVPTNLKSTWIRKGSSCTQFVGAYERCNYAAKETIGGVSYMGLPYKPYSTLDSCLADDLGRDAKTPHGTGDENGANASWKYFSTKVTAANEEAMRNALTSHDTEYGTSYRKLFGYGSILECSGAMNLAGWEGVQVTDPQTNVTRGFFRCEFSFLPGYTNECTPAMQAAGYCDTRGFISSKAPLFGQEAPGQPSVGSVDNSWGHTYGWKDLPYEFMYKRHFSQMYLNGSTAPGGFYILEVNDDQIPTNLPPNYFPWVPGCPSNGQGGPYNGTGGNRFPDGVPPIKKRDMKLSTHKAEIWLGSSKKEEAIKLYELGASDLFSGMYNSFIIKADETRVDVENRLQRGSSFAPTTDDIFQHEKFYENWNKNIVDLRIDPRVWVYIKNNVPHAANQFSFHANIDPQNFSLQNYVDSLYNRTLNLSVIDKKTQIVHIKLGLKPANILSNTDCKGSNQGQQKANDQYCGQSWEYQKTITIKIRDWKVLSTKNSLDIEDLTTNTIWNTDHIQRKFLTSFGTFKSTLNRDDYSQIVSRHNGDINFTEILTGNHYEQYNYAKKLLSPQQRTFNTVLYASDTLIFKPTTFSEDFRLVALSTMSWWELWDKTHYNKKDRRLSAIVGFDKNQHQILRSSKLGMNLTYFTTGGSNGFPPFTNAVIQEAYYEYLPDRPKQYSPSAIRGIRNKLNNYPFSSSLSSRENVLNTTGLNFFFADWSSRWTEDGASTFISPPSDYYYGSYNYQTLLRSHNLLGQHTNRNFYGNRRLDTRSWTNGLWAQLVYDGEIKVDIDSYKNVDFTLPSNPSQYLKYTSFYTYSNSEYSFSEQPAQETTIETVLTPGVLDVTKQVPIKKPTNVELDPNYSFLLYIFPYVTVTKKKKEI
jgi:hypothetical protein